MQSTCAGHLAFLDGSPPWKATSLEPPHWHAPLPRSKVEFYPQWQAVTHLGPGTVFQDIVGAVLAFPRMSSGVGNTESLRASGHMLYSNAPNVWQLWDSQCCPKLPHHLLTSLCLSIQAKFIFHLSCSLFIISASRFQGLSHPGPGVILSNCRLSHLN